MSPTDVHRKTAVVIGATGQVGSILVEKLAASPNYSTITATFRKDGDQEQFRKWENVKPFQLDLAQTTEDNLMTLLDGANDVFFTAGSGGKNVEEIDRDGCIVVAKVLIKLSKTPGKTVPHFVVLSSIGVDQAEKMGELEKYGIAKKKADDFILGDDNLKATILRPGALTDEPEQGEVILGPICTENMTMSLMDCQEQSKIQNTRSDVAETMLQAASLFALDRSSRVIEMINGNDSLAGRPIAKALAAFDKTALVAVDKAMIGSQ